MSRLEDINSDVTSGNISSGDVLYIMTQEEVNLSLRVVSITDKSSTNCRYESKAIPGLRALNLSPFYSKNMTSNSPEGAYLDLERGELWGRPLMPNNEETGFKVELPLHFKDYEIIKKARKKKD